MLSASGALIVAAHFKRQADPIDRFDGQRDLLRLSGVHLDRRLVHVHVDFRVRPFVPLGQRLQHVARVPGAHDQHAQVSTAGAGAAVRR